MVDMSSQNQMDKEDVKESFDKASFVNGIAAGVFVTTVLVTLNSKFRVQPDIQENFDNLHAQYQTALSEQREAHKIKLSEVDRDGFTRGFCEGFNHGFTGGLRAVWVFNGEPVTAPYIKVPLNLGGHFECNVEKKSFLESNEFNRFFPNQRLSVEKNLLESNEFNTRYPEQKLTFGG